MEHFHNILGLCFLLTGTVTGFLLQRPNTINTTEEWSEWKVLQEYPICFLIRQCLSDGCNGTTEYKYCKEIATWEEWGPLVCTIKHNTCFTSRTRNCSVKDLSDCGSSETGHEIKALGDLKLCPCGEANSTTTTPVDLMVWSPWECHQVPPACMVIRRRICKTTSGLETSCDGSQYEMKPCDESCKTKSTTTTPVDLIVWSPWECHNDQSPCVKYRYEICNTSGLEIDCDGSQYEMKPCDESCKKLPYWLEWSVWKCHLAPNHTCEMHRTRNCSTGSLDDCVGKSAMTTNCTNTVCPEIINLSTHVDCSAVDTQATNCLDGPGCSGFKTEFLLQLLCSDPTTVAECPITCGCCVNGQWTDWQEWSKCSHSCSGGTRTRVRTCTNSAPSSGGKNCAGDGNMTEVCNSSDCPEWSKWLYTACSVTCGNGTSTRLRLCSSGRELDCGPGKGQEKVVCHETPCPINGRWADWQEWSKCSHSCSGGIRTRVRTCTNPPPAYGGKDCTGNGTLTEVCQRTTCPEWSQWLYAACSVSCGSGTRTRLRLCSSGNDLDCGPGKAHDSVACSEGPCPST